MASSSHHTELYAHVPATCLPIVYSPVYNITFMGLERLHPFDAGKWGKVIHFLKEEQFITDETIVAAREASEEDLLVVHTKHYLNRLKWSLVVATITEIPPLVFLPNFLVQRKVLRPLRTQTGDRECNYATCLALLIGNHALLIDHQAGLDLEQHVARL
ncbi:histone deacetylase 11 [Silurus asotus]|uniref:Histone deacetylase 11 n=1 Tax=Silurus asotus TaxID=30991 RepID=A0AAD5AD46_SILAS|nr:histone deacetylase 11 [Silurus asotus]